MERFSGRLIRLRVLLRIIKINWLSSIKNLMGKRFLAAIAYFSRGVSFIFSTINLRSGNFDRDDEWGCYDQGLLAPS